MTDMLLRLVPPTRTAPATDAWRDRDPSDLAPVVLLAGGFLTWPRLYRDLAAALRARGAADVVHVPTYLQDWLLAPVRGLGPIVTRTGRALLEACARSAESPRSLGAPILYVGHSAGGISGRILTARASFEGRGANAGARIGALVTLGTPHLVGDEARWGRQLGQAGARFANREVPGAFLAPTVGYVAVGSRYVVGERHAPEGRARTAFRVYVDVNSDLARPEVDAIEGDGLIPLQSALLPGARHVVLDDVVHGPGTRAPWYGRGAAVDAWWPAAVDAWQAALRARAGGAVAPRGSIADRG